MLKSTATCKYKLKSTYRTVKNLNNAPKDDKKEIILISAQRKLQQLILATKNELNEASV